MASRMFRIGQPIELGFYVTDGKKEPTMPKLVYVSLYNDGQEIIRNEVVEPKKNHVEYTIASGVVEKTGDYVANFHVMSDKTEQDFPIHFIVVPNSVPKEAKDTPVDKLTEESTDNDVELAASQSIHQLRKNNVPLKNAWRIVYDTARLRTRRAVTR